jgi:hypothetical protein
MGHIEAIEQMTGTLTADIFVSVAALAGILILMATIRAQNARDPLNQRLLFGLQTVSALLLGRVLTWLTGIFFFEVITIIAAGLVPLATVVVTEGLLRRHAPLAVKIFAAGGSCLFVLLAFLPDGLIEPWRSWGLLAFQAGSFVTAGAVILNRDKKSLSAAENRAAERIALSLLLILPLFATDYRAGYVDVPVRLGGVAILFLCWLTISLGRRHLSHRDTVAAFLVLVVAACASGLVAGALSESGFAFYVEAAVISLCSMLVAVIWNDSISLASERRRQSLIRHLADGDISNTERFLSGLQNHVLVEGALSLRDDDLGDFDLRALRSLFSRHPVLHRSNSEANAGFDEQSREQLAWLFEKYDATHAMIVSNEPFMLVVLTMPAVSTTPGAEAELRAVQRMAILISNQTAIEPEKE